MTLLHRTVLGLAILAVFALSACDAGGPGTEPPPPGPSNTSIRFDFNYIEALNDCDGFPLGEGEFSFTVRANPSFATSTTVYNSSPNLDDGDRTGALGRRDFTTTATNGQQVTVEFRGTEYDYDILGNPFADSRMDGIQTTAQHTYNGSSWSGLGPQTLTLGSGDCRVRLSYTASEI